MTSTRIKESMYNTKVIPEEEVSEVDNQEQNNDQQDAPPQYQAAEGQNVEIVSQEKLTFSQVRKHHEEYYQSQQQPAINHSEINTDSLTMLDSSQFGKEKVDAQVALNGSRETDPGFKAKQT